MNYRNEPFSEDDTGRISRAQQKDALFREFLSRCEENGRTPFSIPSAGKKIASTFWGAAWCRNVDAYHDYESRLPMGRTLLRKGAVLDLDIHPGLVRAVVADGELYEPEIRIEPADETVLAVLRRRCSGELTTLMDLLQGKFSDSLMEILGNPVSGLYPPPENLKTACSCFDDSILCRHAAAALYGLGIAFDKDPALFFRLRGIDPEDFFRTGNDLSESLDEGNGTENDLEKEDLGAIFGIDIG